MPVDPNSRPDLEAAYARHDERLRAVRAKLAQERTKEHERKERTRLLIQLGGVCAARGFTDVDELGAFLDAAGRPEQRRRRR